MRLISFLAAMPAGEVGVVVTAKRNGETYTAVINVTPTAQLFIRETHMPDIPDTVDSISFGSHRLALLLDDLVLCVGP